VAAFGKSKKTETGGLNSQIGYKGIIKKVCIFVIIAVCHGVETFITTDSAAISQGVTVAFACNEALSIIENMGLLGVPLGPVAGLIDILKKEAKTEDQENEEA
jgi:toxin secretion/phage lysis holin